MSRNLRPVTLISNNMEGVTTSVFIEYTTAVSYSQLDGFCFQFSKHKKCPSKITKL